MHKINHVTNYSSFSHSPQPNNDKGVAGVLGGITAGIHALKERRGRVLAAFGFSRPLSSGDVDFLVLLQPA